MVHVALCGNIVSGDDASATLVRCARAQAIPEPDIVMFHAPFELLEHLENSTTEPLIDLVILRAESGGMSGLQTVRDARAAGYAGEIILVEDTETLAHEALRLHVGGYLLEPVSPAAFESEAARSLARLSTLDDESAIIRMRGGLRRVLFTQLVYAQTSNHDQVLHMRDGQTMQLRSSSQDLFDRLSHDPRFLKLGSSYIVNLDLVYALEDSGGTLRFIEGSTASVPVRFRKQVQDALFARAEWRKHA